jgi:hypothetical protein
MVDAALITAAVAGLTLGLLAEWLVARHGWKAAQPVSLVVLVAAGALYFRMNDGGAALAMALAYAASSMFELFKRPQPQHA